jgi:hypothetical protein
MGFVIVVGTVDTVDISAETVYLDEVLCHPPGCWVWPVNGTRPPCGQMRGNPFTGLSTRKGAFRSNPYFGRLAGPRPYMGVLLSVSLPRLTDFSTPNAVYPQIIATYPQKNMYGTVFVAKQIP